MAVKLHAPSRSWVIVSLVIAVIAVIGAVSPIPLAARYAFWAAILAYMVLAIDCLA